MKMLLLCLMGLLSQQALIGQTTYSKDFDLSEDVDLAVDINFLPDGFMLSGTSGYLQNTRFAMSLMKVDPAGNLIWKKLYGTQDSLNQPSAGYGANLLVLDSVLYFFNRVADSTVQYQFGVLKLDLDGKVLADYRYPRADSVQIDLAWNIYSCPDDNILLYGMRFTNLDYIDLLLRKISPDGVLLWEQTVGWPQHREDSWNVAFGPDSTFLFSTFTCSDSTACLDTFHYVLRKMDLDGKLVWKKNYLKSKANKVPPFSYVLSRPGGYYLTGGREIPQNDPAYGTATLVILGLDEEGLVDWELALKDWSLPDYAMAGNYAVSLQNGDMMFCGLGYKNFETKGLILRFSPDGKMVYRRLISDPSISDPHDGEFYDAVEAENGDLLLAGKIDRTNVSGPARVNYWMVRLDSLGCIEPGCQDEEQVFTEPSVITTYPAIQGVLRAWPVPCPSGHPLQVQVATGGGELVLSDLIGRVVATETRELTTSPMEISTANLLPGVYTLSYRYNRGKSVDAIQVVIQ
ncbi:MAG: hypothetical protein K9I85_12745 [Saprospiraceae bacterium]|nr:hypothetical protein [Saprospiraceae bacterium]